MRGPGGVDTRGVQRIFFRGGRKYESQLEGPIIRAEARRAKAAGDEVQGKGRLLPLGRKIFDF